MAALGVGLVEKNTVRPTTILKQVKNIRMRKTIITPFVVKKNRDSNKKNTVVVDIADIAQEDGKIFFLIRYAWRWQC